MSSKIKFSIISVVYNRVSTIENMIKSVIAQDYDDIEFIIIDGKSTDGTVEVLKRYDKYITFWSSEPDNGIYDAMNKGIIKATGDYIQFIGSDDCFLNSRVISSIAQEICDSADIFSSRVICVDEACNYEKDFGHYEASFGQYKFPWIQHGGAFVKLGVAKKYIFDTEYKVAADLKFILQCVIDPDIYIQYSDIQSIYFAMSGFSSEQNNDLCMFENQKIMDELGIDCCVKKTSRLKKLIKSTSLFAYYQKVRKIYSISWRKHECGNSWCRWCR